MAELMRPTVEEYREQQKLPIVLVLDNVRSLHNVGSAFRTADAMGIEQIILTGITGTPPHREIEKTALGSTLSVDWHHEKNINTALSALRSKGYKLLAVEQAFGSTNLNDFTPDRADSYVLIFGNEVDGVSDEAMSMVDACLEIPQSGTKHSLNIVVSIGMVLWDFSSKLKR